MNNHLSILSPDLLPVFVGYFFSLLEERFLRARALGSVDQLISRTSFLMMKHHVALLQAAVLSKSSILRTYAKHYSIRHSSNF